MGRIGIRQYISFAILVFLLSIVSVIVVQKTMMTDAAPGINKTINFQGKMTDDQGLNVADGNYQFVFRLYTVASSGTAVWTETVNLDVADGIFQHNLGSTAPLPGSVDFNTDNIFLGITFNSDPDGEMTPRIQLTASPYAFNADQLDGLDASDFVQLSPSVAQTGDINVTGNVSGANGAFSNSVVVGNASQAGSIAIYDGSSDYGVLSASALTAPRAYTLPDASGEICLDIGNCDNSLFTDSGTHTYLTSVTDEMVLGSTSSINAKLGVVGTADQVQILVRAHSGQTDPLILAQDSSGGELFRLHGEMDTVNSVGTLALGYQALQSNVFDFDATSGYANTAIGHYALRDNTTGYANTAVGQGALISNTIGGINVAIGYSALVGNVDGSANVAIGALAGHNLVSGGSNVAIGFNTPFASATGFSQLNIANILTSSNYVTGNLEIGTSNTIGQLLVLDIKTSAGDPTGANGGMYYNSSAGKFRCYQNSSWTDCIGSGGGIASLNGLTGSSQTFVNDTNVTITSAGTTHTLGWTGTLSAARGGTGQVSYTTGDILYASDSNTLGKLAIGTAKQCLTVTGGLPVWGGCGPNSVTYVVAANDSPAHMKAAADYVADGTSDEDEINAALTAGAGGRIYLAEGTYVADGTILIPNNTTLEGAGAGTVIEIADIDVTDNLVEATGTNRTGQTIRNLTLDGRNDLNTAGSQNGISFSSVGATTPHRTGGTVDSVTVQNFRSTGVSLFSSHKTTITGNTITGNNYGINTYNSNNNTVSNNTVSSNTTGIYLHGSNNTVTGNTTSNNTNQGIYLVGSGSAVNNTVTGNTSSGNNYGIYLASVSNNTITGNTVNDNTNNGIHLNFSHNNIVSSNIVHNNGGTSANSGIQLLSSDNNQIIGNQITDTAGTSYAINVSGAGNDGNYLADNTFSGTGASSIGNTGTGTVYGVQQDGSGGMLLTGNFLPSSNDAYNLGSNTARWKDLWVGGETIHIGTSTTDEGTISYDTTNNILQFSTDSTTNGDIAFFSNQLYLDKSTGNVGIGTATPEQVGGTFVYPSSGLGAARVLNVTGTGDQRARLVLQSGATASSGGGGIQFYSSMAATDEKWYALNQLVDGDLAIQTLADDGTFGATHLQMDRATGNLTLGAGGSSTTKLYIYNDSTTSSTGIYLANADSGNTANAITVRNYTGEGIVIHPYDSATRAAISVRNSAGGYVAEWRMSGEFRAPDTGIGHSFLSDSDTGMGRSGTDQLSFYTANTERLTINSSGRVGIENSAFSSLFAVGTVNSSLQYSNFDGLRISGEDTTNTIYNSGRSIAITADSGNTISLCRTSVCGTAGLIFNTTTGNVDIDGAGRYGFVDNSTGDKLHLYSNTYGIGIESSTFTYWSASQFRWRVGGTSVSSGTQEMLLTSSGLTIGGSLDATSLNTGYGYFEIGQHLRTTDGVTFAGLTSNGNVYVSGSTNPRLYISSTSGSVSPRVMDVAGTDWRFYREGGAEGTAVLMTLAANGNLTVGQLLRGAEVQWSSSLSTSTGACLATGTWNVIYRCSSSSQRYKHDIQDFTDGLDAVRQLRPVTFYYNEGASLDRSKQVGLIAEEVAAINPLFATFNPDGSVESVRYDRIAELNTNAIKELDVQVQANDVRLTVLEQSVASLSFDSSAYASAASVQTMAAGLVQRISTLENGMFSGGITVAGPAVFNSTLTVMGDTYVQSITVAGKIITAGATPAGTVLGTNVNNEKTVEITGNDTAGEISLALAQTALAAPGEQLSVQFVSAFGAKPRINLTPISSAAAQVRYYVEPSETGFKLYFIDAPVPGETYSFNYFAVE